MTPPNSNNELGQRIKQIRLSQGFTLKDIEAKVNVSATHVSEVERGKTSPTVGALSKIAAALNVNPSFLVDIPMAGRVSITRSDDRLVLHAPREPGRWEILTRENPFAELSLFVLVLDADMKEPVVRSPRPGDKFLHVVEGMVEIELSDEKHVLREGDSIHFKSSHPHKVMNLADGASRVFWADWPRFTL